ncbi:hypothetical protein MSPP1_002175 [Malassezia sp. CBS 17886]|nr:hypothetical protein MSPP1_002175 [Malassezia sp. CBS 17886]
MAATTGHSSAADAAAEPMGSMESGAAGGIAQGGVSKEDARTEDAAEPTVYPAGEGTRNAEDEVFSWKKLGTIAACGAALFSDGYVNSSIGTVNTIFKKLYPGVYTSHRSSVVSAIAFAGTVIGMLIFGFVSDAMGRKSGMIIATLIILVFTALSAGSYYKGDIGGMLNMLTAWRFFTGVGIGAEYPTGSVAAAEKTEEMPRRFQHGPFIFVTNFMIDAGFVTAAFVPLVLTWIAGENHDRLNWRLTLGLGVVPCLIVLPFRFAMKQPRSYVEGGIKPVNIPYWLVIKRYWFRLMTISIIWFIYDFITYPFGLYSSVITDNVIENPTQVKTFGWAVVITLFYIPGAFLGACTVDILGPKKTLVTGLTLQIIMGFILSGLYVPLTKHIAAFCVVYGLFLSFGEFGPGDNLGLIASKSCATCVKGQFYGIAAAIGKIGAFAGTYAFPEIQSRYATTDPRYNTVPFYIGSALECVSLVLAIFLIKERSADCQKREDEDFRTYLEVNGFDMSLFGRPDEEDRGKVVSIDYSEKPKLDV